MADRSVKVTLSVAAQQYSAGIKKAAADTEGLTKKTSALSRQIKQTFVGGAVFAGIAAIGAAIHKTFTLGLTFTEQMNTLGAVTHATDGQMQHAAETAKALGNAIDIPNTSASDAADAMVELAKGGLSLDSSMKAARGTLMLAAAAQVSGAQAATVQAQALNEFNLNADKASHVADVLANTANAASGEITDIATALTYSGGVAHQFGISIDDAATMLGIFAKNGLIGSMAGTTLRSMLIHLAAPSKQAQAAMQELGLTIHNAQGEFVGLRSLSQQLAEAQAKMTPAAFQAATAIVFGQRAVQGAGYAAKAGAAGFDEFGKSVTVVGGAVDLANAKMKGLPGTLQRARNELENVALSLEQALAPAVESIADHFTSFVKSIGPSVISVFKGVFDILKTGVTVLSKVADLFKAMPGPVQDLAKALLAVGLANKIGVFSRFATTVAKVKQEVAFASYEVQIGAGRFAKYGQMAKNASRSVIGAFGGPWGLAIAGAATGIGLLIKKWQDAKPVVRDFTDAVDANTGALADNATQAAASVLQADLAKWKQLGGDVGVYTAAVLGNADAQKQVQAELPIIAENLAKQGNLYQNNAAAFQQAGITQQEVLNAVRQHVQGNDDAWGGLVDRLNAARVPFGDISRANSAMKTTFAALQPIMDQYQTNVGGLNKELEKAKVEHEAAAGAAEYLGGKTKKTTDATEASFLAYDSARKALNGYGDAATATTEKLSALMQATIDQTSAMLNQALQTRQAIGSALTGFVSPTGAWDDTVDRLNAQRSARQSAVKQSNSHANDAADAAVKAARRRADSTKKSAKDERDAAVDAADKIRDAIVARAEADEKATKQAEQDARNRVQAAKNEADRLRQISEQRTKDAKDSALKLEDAQARMTAADAAVAAARAGLAGAQTPVERASWERALNGALDEQADATTNLASAQADYTDKTRKANDAKVKSKDATDKQTDAEKTYQGAQKDSAKVTENTSARKKQADDDYTRAKEKADNRYNKSVDAVESALQALIDKQDATRQSAEDMSSGATGALSNMAKDAKPTLQQYLDTLQDQVDAQRKWKDNIVKLAGRLPTDVALQLAQLGPKSAPMIQALVGGTDKQLDQFAKLFPQSTDKGVQDMVNSIVRAIVPVGDNALNLSNAMIEKFLKEFSSAKTNAQAQQAIVNLRNAMQEAANKAPAIVFSTTLDLAKVNQQMADSFGPGYNPVTFWGQAPKYAAGGDVKDGWFWSGEQGPELGYKSGSSVKFYPASQSAKMASGPSIQQNVVINYPQGVPPAVATVNELRDAAAMVGVAR